MRPEERRKKIVQMVSENGYISFWKLKEACEPISEMTLRRDLDTLDKAGSIIRVHGGAKSVEVAVGSDDLLLRRSTRNVAAKEVIAQKAIELVKANTVVFLDSGSTATLLARHFPDISCMVFTTGISCMQEMLHLEKTQLHMIGGGVNKESQSACSFRSLSYINNVNFQVAFLGVTGFSLDHGFTCGKEDECEMKRLVIQNADVKVALMDSSKIGVESTFTYAALKDIDMIITDGAVDQKTLSAMKAAGVEIL